MTTHVFGLVVTPFGTAANNRGETEGSITTLQKILWNGDVHTSVSAEAIRFAIRYYWQLAKGDQAVNRRWEAGEKLEHTWADWTFSNWQQYIDDDVLGFMKAEGAKEDASDSPEAGRAAGVSKGSARRKGEAKEKRDKERGTIERRRARLEVTRAISVTPFAGDITFNAAQIGATPSASSTGKDPVPYGAEVHATRYQYGFALTPERLHNARRALDVIDAIVNLRDVAGNHARFLFDFAPDAVLFRITHDPAPRILYGFAATGENGYSDARALAVPDIVKRVEWGDLNAAELILGGAIVETEDGRKLVAAGAWPKEGRAGVKAAAEEVKQRLAPCLKTAAQ